MNEQDWQLINDYFDGLLSESEREAVVRRAESDAAFAAEMALRQQMDQWLAAQPGRQAVQQTLTPLGDQYFKQETAPTAQPMQFSVARRWLAAAAALLVLCVAAWWLLRPQASLYQQYALHAPLQLTQRGTEQVLATAAESAFQQKNYTAAAESLQQLLAQQPDNNTARLYLGICQTETNQTDAAMQTLLPLATGQTALRADGLWYIALSQVKAGNNDVAKVYLSQIQAGDDHFEAAGDLLDALNK